MTTRALHELLDLSAVRFPDKVAVEEAENGSICYGELAQLSDRVRDQLREMGVGVGDRVGICARKSGDVVASIFGIMGRWPWCSKRAGQSRLRRPLLGWMRRGI